MARMVPITRLYADADGHARFEDVEIALFPAFGPGDVLLVEDTDGFGHSSRTPDGFVAAFVVLDP